MGFFCQVYYYRNLLKYTPELHELKGTGFSPYVKLCIFSEGL